MNYPRFLWRDGKYDEEHPEEGFLESSILVKVIFSHNSPQDATNAFQAMRHIAISPSSAGNGNNKSSKRGYAALNGITKITPAAIAYSAVMVCLWCSAEPGHHLTEPRYTSHCPAQKYSLRMVAVESGSSPTRSSTMASSKPLSHGQTSSVSC